MTEEKRQSTVQPEQIQGFNSPAEDEINLIDLLKFIARKKVFILAVTSVCALFSILYVQSITPTYRATVDLLTQNETFTNLSDQKEEVFSENVDHVTAEKNLFEADSIEQIIPNNETPLTLEDEYTPKLFSEETALEEDSGSTVEEEQKLFDQDKNQEEDFEIPAFLRRQKF